MRPPPKRCNTKLGSLETCLVTLMVLFRRLYSSSTSSCIKVGAVHGVGQVLVEVFLLLIEVMWWDWG
jgi:hypothetical protein